MKQLKNILLPAALLSVGILSCHLNATETTTADKTQTEAIEKEVPIICGRPVYDEPKDLKDFKSQKSLFDTKAKWDTKELLVYFIDTKDTATIGKTLRVANEWAIPGRIQFLLTGDRTKSQIRVSFRNSGGYRSNLGAQNFNKDTTMFLQNLDLKSDSEFRRVVLHEFGHALGFRHELQNPKSPIIWNEPAVLDYFKTVYKMDPETVRKQVLRPVKLAYVRASEFDSASVMIYAVPAFLTMNYKHDIPWSYSLSKRDKATLAENY